MLNCGMDRELADQTRNLATYRPRRSDDLINDATTFTDKHACVAAIPVVARHRGGQRLIERFKTAAVSSRVRSSMADGRCAGTRARADHLSKWPARYRRTFLAFLRCRECLETTRVCAGGGAQDGPLEKAGKDQL